jgi:hypothetical protein
MRVLGLLLLLSACQQDFESQYAETEKRVKATEAKIDDEMLKAAKQEPGE